MWGKVVKHTGEPPLVAFVAKEIIRFYDVPARDDAKLARAVQVWAQQNLKYFREFPERWVAPLTTQDWGIADCDDFSIFILAALRSFRIPGRLKFLRMVVNGKRFSHVYPQVKLGGRWVSLEAVRPYAMGKDPEDVAIKRGFKPIVEIIGDK